MKEKNLVKVCSSNLTLTCPYGAIFSDALLMFLSFSRAEKCRGARFRRPTEARSLRRKNLQDCHHRRNEKPPPSKLNDIFLGNFAFILTLTAESTVLCHFDL